MHLGSTRNSPAATVPPLPIPATTTTYWSEFWIDDTRHDGVVLIYTGEASTSLTDLRRGPAIFIGAFDNGWTLRLTAHSSVLRVFYARTAKRTVYKVKRVVGAP